MKIVVPTNGESLDSEICKSFGRTKRFLVVDAESLEFESVENTQNMQSAQGAGIQSAQSSVKAGGDVVVTMHCGPKAYRVLTESGVRVFTAAEGTVRQNVEAFSKGELAQMNDANVEGHWV